MKLISRKIGATFYTEYTVKPGETLNQIAKEQLHDQKRTAEIYRWNNNKPEPVTGSNINGWVLLIPPVAPALLAIRQAADQKLKELLASAEKGTITAEAYYEQRKLIVSVL